MEIFKFAGGGWLPPPRFMKGKKLWRQINEDENFQKEYNRDILGMKDVFSSKENAILFVEKR